MLLAPGWVGGLLNGTCNQSPDNCYSKCNQPPHCDSHNYAAAFPHSDRFTDTDSTPAGAKF